MPSLYLVLTYLTLCFLATFPCTVLGHDNMRFLSPEQYQNLVEGRTVILAGRKTDGPLDGALIPVTICQPAKIREYSKYKVAGWIKKFLPRYLDFSEVTVQIRSYEDIISSETLPAFTTRRIVNYHSFFEKAKHQNVSDGGIWLASARYKNEKGFRMLMPVLKSAKYEPRVYLFMKGDRQISVRCYDRLFEMDNNLKYTIDGQEILEELRYQISAVVNNIFSAIWVRHDNPQVRFTIAFPTLDSTNEACSYTHSIVLSYTNMTRPSSSGGNAPALFFKKYDNLDGGKVENEQYCTIHLEFPHGISFPPGVNFNQRFGLQLVMGKGAVSNHIPIRFFNDDEVYTAQRLYGDLIDMHALEASERGREAFERSEKVVKVRRNEGFYLELFEKGKCGNSTDIKMVLTYKYTLKGVKKYDMTRRLLKGSTYNWWTHLGNETHHYETEKFERGNYCTYRLKVASGQHEKFYDLFGNGKQLVKMSLSLSGENNYQPIVWRVHLGKDDVTEFKSF